MGRGTPRLPVPIMDNRVSMTRELAVREAQQIVRKSIQPGRSLVDELLRERRPEIAREAKVVREMQRADRRTRPRLKTDSSAGSLR